MPALAIKVQQRIDDDGRSARVSQGFRAVANVENSVGTMHPLRLPTSFIA